jgi:hypothetical protein
MLAKRSIALLLAVCCSLGLGVAALASDGGTEHDTPSAQVDCDSIYCFSGEEFGEALTGACILNLPDSKLGTVMLGTRVVRRGDILSAEQLSQLTFHPLPMAEDAQATVTYLPIYEDRVEKETTMTISIRGKEDKAPAALDSVLETYKNLPNGSKLKASDPEGGVMTFSVIRGPRRGEVSIAPDGSFTYTPKKNKVGTDSFTYTATDEAGNVSREATVTVRILKPADKTFYADTLGQDCRFAAEWMKNTGLFVGETIGQQCCFQPDRTVSRGEFVAMLVQSLGLQVDKNGTPAGNMQDCPGWLKPYLAAAQRSGLMDGWQDTVNLSQPITGAEAAVMLQNALDLTVPGDVLTGAQAAGADIPTWAFASLTVMAEHGISLSANRALTRGEAAQALYQMYLLAPDAPGMVIFRMQK